MCVCDREHPDYPTEAELERQFHAMHPLPFELLDEEGVPLGISIPRKSPEYPQGAHGCAEEEDA